MTKSLSVPKAEDASVFPIASEQIVKASKALLSHMRKAAKEASASASKKNLLEDDEGSDMAQEPIWLNLTTKRNVRDDNSLKPGRVAVPHPLIPADSEATICLVVADPQRAYKDIVASDEFPAALAKRITRVVDVTHLQAKFRTFEAQRQLFASHDVFLADDRIINRLPKCLGKTFYRSTAKRPIPVYLAPRKPKSDKSQQQQPKKKGSGKKEKGDEANARPAAEIAAEVQAATGAALVHLSPSTSTAVKVGFGGWTADQLAENAAAVARALVERHIPRKWANVRSVFLKGTTTAALPLWQTDELWLDGAKDVLPEGSEELKALEDKKNKEKPNVGRKRKALEAAAEDAAADGEEVEEVAAAEAKKPAKKKAKVPVVESNDDKLDKQIKERKDKLKKQKKAAKLAMEA
ncbi:hypothetical protein GGTG_12296 [Gaeumannomyces tritici R3-111a-1]|uniref:Uncharacterized protein n=1 Tax=Gaeumannomyces tritici (strain R3-111a-1) TaxID=644352 RepID=J3PFM1_GAET3|nr:hypothetical protein GGTG_12296 [Gaeumannomyces tritici R3-111a-1]EJT70123.1 hypothetical protein GGTG_12296 [Gaeumannomyces tritici R3-111a-1]